ncbi:hypothetical protein ACFCP7_15405 [Paenibacillus elgii]
MHTWKRVVSTALIVSLALSFQGAVRAENPQPAVDVRYPAVLSGPMQVKVKSLLSERANGGTRIGVVVKMYNVWGSAARANGRLILTGPFVNLTGSFAVYRKRRNCLGLSTGVGHQQLKQLDWRPILELFGQAGASRPRRIGSRLPAVRKQGAELSDRRREAKAG